MTERECSQVTWGTATFSYSIRRSARRRTVSLAVDPAEGLLVTAPEGTPVMRLDAIVRAKARWVLERLRGRQALPPLPPRELTSGETFLYLGRQYRLRLRRGMPEEPMVLVGGWLEVPVPAGLAGRKRREYTRAVLIGWYRRHAAERLPMRAERWAARLDAPLGRVLVRDAEKRWGSCSGGTIRLNWRIIQAPMSLVDYVVAHELVHTLHDNHGREFWRTLGRVMPDYEERKQQLRALGPRLDW